MGSGSMTSSLRFFFFLFFLFFRFLVRFGSGLRQDCSSSAQRGGSGDGDWPRVHHRSISRACQLRTGSQRPSFGDRSTVRDQPSVHARIGP